MSGYQDPVLSCANASITLVITITAICANWIIVGLFCRFRKLRNLNNTAVTFLSICDLMRSCIIMTIKVYNHYSMATDLIEPFCTLTAFTSAFTFVFNPMLLALIAAIRYIKIVSWKPCGLPFTDKHLYITASALMLIAVLFSCLPFFNVGHYAYSKTHGVCFTNWDPQNTVFRIIFYIIVIGLSFPVLTICYGMLYNVLRKHKKAVRKNELKRRAVSFTQEEEAAKRFMFLRDFGKKRKRAESAESVSELSTSIEMMSSDVTTSGNHQITNNGLKISKKRRISKQECRAINLMIIIFLAYIICWMPALIVNVIALIKGPNHLHVFWFYFIATLVELKSALNPIIYGFGNFQYQKALRKLLR